MGFGLWSCWACGRCPALKGVQPGVLSGSGDAKIVHKDPTGWGVNTRERGARTRTWQEVHGQGSSRERKADMRGWGSVVIGLASHTTKHYLVFCQYLFPLKRTWLRPIYFYPPVFGPMKVASRGYMFSAVWVMVFPKSPHVIIGFWGLLNLPMWFWKYNKTPCGLRKVEKVSPLLEKGNKLSQIIFRYHI